MNVTSSMSLFDKASKRIAENVDFKLKEFNDCHWRMFEAMGSDNHLCKFLWVYGNDEVCLFIGDRNLGDHWFPMKESWNSQSQSYVLKNGEEYFEQCRRIICEEDGWKKDVLLLHRSPRKLIKGLCNATVLEPHIFTEVEKHRPKKRWWAS